MTTTASQRRWVMGFCAVVALIATLYYFRSEKVSEPSTQMLANCTNQLAFIDTVITRWATNNGKGYYRGTLDFPSRSDLVNYISNTNLLNCPEGGEYQLGTLNLATICNRHGHAHKLQPPRSTIQKFSDEVMWQILASLHMVGRVTASKNACIANLKQIDGATQQWALENKMSTTNVVHVLGAVEYLKGSQMPFCPEGGKYILKRVGDSPECTVIGHKL